MKKFKLLDVLAGKYSQGMRIIKGERYSADNHRAIQYHSGGEDYCPTDETDALCESIDGNNANTVVYLYKDGVARISEKGEKRTYATDEAGSEVVAEIHLKNDGDVDITATKDANIGIEGNCNVTVKGNTNLSVTGDIIAVVGGNVSATVTGLFSVIASGISFLANTMTGSADLNINCDKVDINSSGACTVNSPSVDLGVGGQPIARLGDQVTVDGNTHIGTITTASANNTSN